VKTIGLSPFGFRPSGFFVQKSKLKKKQPGWKISSKRLVFVPALVIVIVLFAASSTKAQSGKHGLGAKLTPNLINLYEQHAVQLAQRGAAQFSSGDPLITPVNDRVVIDAVASGDVEALKSDLTALGMQQAVSFGRVVSGQLPIAAISAVAGLATLRFAQSAAATTHAGSVNSQGDNAIRADLARQRFGVTGSGVTVGVLSDSFDCLGGTAADFISGNLPPVMVVEEISICTGATDEGRAILQIIHDVAPGASLAFASAFNGQASFAANIQALATAGAKVIIDDVLYFAEPMFQDGIIAQAVDSVVAGGVAYFSSAGNQARQSYQSVFRAGDSFADGAFPSIFDAPHFFGGVAHNFDSSGGKKHFQSITIPAFTTVVFSFQWDSPFFSVSGPPGTQNDLDVYLLDAAATRVVGGSAFNNIGGDALEFFGVRNNGAAPVTVNLMLVKYSGIAPGMIKYVYFGPADINDFDTQSSTIFGHANAAGAEAVGAARYSSTPVFGVYPPILASFSSAGSTPIIFDSAGDRLARPNLRPKPEIVAPDGIDTTFFGSDTDGNGFPNFFGTSAAAPHAAAVAALLLEARPKLNPAKIYRRLENSAIDMGTPGFDNDTGFGLIQADATLGAIRNEPVADFDGDGKSDVGVYRDGIWFILRSSDGKVTTIGWGGLAQDIAVPGDYDGDGRIDIAIYRGGVWFIIRSSDEGQTVVNWGGLAEDVPVPADYDGDGKTDVAVYRSGLWFITRSSDGGQTVVSWGGLAQDVPVPADYDGDGKVDIAFYRDGTWVILRSSNGETTSASGGGLVQDVPVQADYDGDGKADIALYRDGMWLIIRSSDGGQMTVGWGGLVQDVPVPADYDGDGKFDIAVYRDGTWFIRRSSDGVQIAVGWGGLAQDVPLN
jgi:hypothetical protein